MMPNAVAALLPNSTEIGTGVELRLQELLYEFNDIVLD